MPFKSGEFKERNRFQIMHYFAVWGSMDPPGGRAQQRWAHGDNTNIVGRGVYVLQQRYRHARYHRWDDKRDCCRRSSRSSARLQESNDADPGSAVCVGKSAPAQCYR